MTNIEAKFEPLALSRNDWPATPTVCSTPGVLPAICSMRATTSRVRWTDAESGNWAVTIRYPLSWLGMNPVGTVMNP